MPQKVQKKPRKTIIYIISIGVLVAFLLQVVFQGISVSLHFFYALSLAKTSVAPAKEYAEAMKHPAFAIILFDTFMSTVRLLTCICLGFIVSQKVGRKGFLYGGLIGAIWQMIAIIPTIILAVSWALLPGAFLFGSPYTKYSQEYTHIRNIRVYEILQTFPNYLLRSYLIILLSAFAGWLGEWLAHKGKI